MTFRIEVPPPHISEPTASTNRTSAELNVTVNTEGGRLGSCSFQYGTSTAYGKEAQCAFLSSGTECAFKIPPASGCEFPIGQDVSVYARISKLAAGTTYYYRVSAENEAGDGRVGAITGSFVTQASETSGSSGGGTQGGSGTGAAQQVLAAAIRKQASKPICATRIAALLKRGSCKIKLEVPVAGTAVVAWYFVPAATKAGKGAHKVRPVTVAYAKQQLTAGGATTLKLVLTAAGRRLLEKSSKLSLTASLRFEPLSGKPVAISKSFKLVR